MPGPKPWIKLWKEKLLSSANIDGLNNLQFAIYMRNMLLARDEEKYEGMLCYPSGVPIEDWYLAEKHHLRVDRFLAAMQNMVSKGLYFRLENGTWVIRKYREHQLKYSPDKQVADGCQVSGKCLTDEWQMSDKPILDTKGVTSLSHPIEEEEEEEEYITNAEPQAVTAPAPQTSASRSSEQVKAPETPVSGEAGVSSGVSGNSPATGLLGGLVSKIGDMANPPLKGGQPEARRQAGNKTVYALWAKWTQKLRSCRKIDLTTTRCQGKDMKLLKGVLSYAQDTQRVFAMVDMVFDDWDVIKSCRGFSDNYPTIGILSVMKEPLLQHVVAGKRFGQTLRVEHDAVVRRLFDAYRTWGGTSNWDTFSKHIGGIVVNGVANEREIDAVLSDDKTGGSDIYTVLKAVLPVWKTRCGRSE